MRSVRFFAALVAVSVVFAPAAGAEPTEVGTTAATNTATKGTPPRMASRNLFIGTNVFFEERIETSKTGQAQLLFLDESALTIASNSDVVIDKFIYDPKTSKGELALSVGAGLFRFVGGRISKTAGVRIKTPTATLGIRGGIAIIKVEPGTNATRASFMFGKEMTVTNDSGVTRRVTRPGFAVDVASLVDSPSSPFKVSGAVIGSYLTELEGRTGQTAGSDDPPTDKQVADSGCCPAVDPEEIIGGPTAGTGGTDGGTDGGTLPPEVPECCDFTETNPKPSPPRTLNGFSGGAFELLGDDAPVTSIFANATVDPSDIEIVTDAVSGTVTAKFDVQELDATGSVKRIEAVFGGTGVSEFVDNTKFRIDDPTASATFEGAPATTASLFLKTSNLVGLPTGVDFCQCEFLQWGFWGGDLQISTNNSVSVGLVDGVPDLAYWVAGEIPALLDMPTGGTATYSGHAIGTVNRDGEIEQAVGGFTQTYDFATMSGPFSVTDFDGVPNYNGSVSAISGQENRFTGTGTGTFGSSLTLTINLNGAFFSGGGDPVAQVGGGFDINEPGVGYEASGIFAGAKP